MIDDNNINRLYDEAVKAGDKEMAGLCTLAVFGPNIARLWCADRGVDLPFAWTQAQARAECARVIADGQG